MNDDLPSEERTTDDRPSDDDGRPTVRVEVDDAVRSGPAIDLDSGVGPESVVRAVRGETVAGIAIQAPDPGPAHERVGLVDDEVCVTLRAALAAAARSRGERAPQADAIADCRAELAELDPPVVDAAEARRRAAEASDEETRLHERVAEIRGRVQTLREVGDEERLAEAKAELRETASTLTEIRTERIAAQQAIEQAADQHRESRDCRERRMVLEDRIGNLEREARAHLAETVAEAFAAALAVVPGEGRIVREAGDGTSAIPEFEGDDTTAALAIARVADLRAPIVLACGRFPDAESAAERLDAPVIRIERG